MLKTLLGMAAGAALLISPAIATAGEKTETVKVKGWSCGGCAAGTKMTITKLDGVKKVETDVAEGTATVTFDDEKVTVALIIKAVERSGYDVAR